MSEAQDNGSALAPAAKPRSEEDQGKPEGAAVEEGRLDAALDYAHSLTIKHATEESKVHRTKNLHRRPITKHALVKSLNWMASKERQDHRYAVMAAHYQIQLPRVIQALYKKALSGDTGAIRLYLERFDRDFQALQKLVAGRGKDEGEGSVSSRLVEVVQRLVSTGQASVTVRALEARVEGNPGQDQGQDAKGTIIEGELST